MAFPYERYASLVGPLKTYYPAGQEELAQQIAREVEMAGKLLGQLLERPLPAIEIVLVAPADWEFVPREDEDEDSAPAEMLPYWTDVTGPSTLVVPEQMDEIIGEPTPEKRSMLLYHELAHAFLENDPRPWPEESPLWADEWPLQFAAFWLFQQIQGSTEKIMADLHQQFAAIFEPEADGKTPVTIRGFDWYEDTRPEDYLEFVLLLEKFAMDLLARYDATILPRFLDHYRQETPRLLSDEVARMLAEVLGRGGEEWLEDLVYF
ncbi:MAG TPA: hypothetical protein VKV19_01555 [Ktedonobacteraceae bacterium]|jgi:hypothetical protein|nr:hypothetical protein [Ktedonobacteraceae bacterium]